MKFKDKDIKNLLNKETNDLTPDVYHNVKSAPLHSLLKGEVPARAFKKTMVTMLLVSTMLLLIVLAFCLIVYFNATDAPVKFDASYVKIIIENGDNTQNIGIIANTNGEVICAIDEVNEEKLPYFVDINTLINSALILNDGDKVSIEILSDNGDNALGQMMDYTKFLKNAYGQKTATIANNFNSLAVKTDFVYLINKTNDNANANTSTSIDELAQFYIAYADKL